MAGLYASYPVGGGGGGATWMKYTVSYTAFTGFTGLQQASIPIVSVPAGTAFYAVCANVTQLFDSTPADPSLSIDFNIGNDGTLNGGALAVDITADVVHKTLPVAGYAPSGPGGGANGLGLLSVTGPQNITAIVNITASAITLDQLSAGSVDIYIQTAQVF